MRLLEDLTYYEILEILPDATANEIRKARQDMLALYQDPLVTEAFFTEAEKKQIVERIETAFAVLSDPDKKRIYDQTQQTRTPTVPSPRAEIRGSDKHAGTTFPPFSPQRSSHSSRITKKAENVSPSKETQQLSASICAREKISGRDIQAIRRSLNISVSNIFEITRIRKAIIRAIEADRFDDLPPDIYLKSFLRTYAKILQLPPDMLTRGYLKNRDAMNNGG